MEKIIKKVTCDNCNIEIIGTAKYITINGGRSFDYCSIACRDEIIKSEARQKIAFTFKEGDHIKKCKGCGKLYAVRSRWDDDIKYLSSHNPVVGCSTECIIKQLNTQIKGK